MEQEERRGHVGEEKKDRGIRSMILIVEKRLEVISLIYYLCSYCGVKKLLIVDVNWGDAILFGGQYNIQYNDWYYGFDIMAFSVDI